LESTQKLGASVIVRKVLKKVKGRWLVIGTQHKGFSRNGRNKEVGWRTLRIWKRRIGSFENWLRMSKQEESNWPCWRNVFMRVIDMDQGQGTIGWIEGSCGIGEFHITCRRDAESDEMVIEETPELGICCWRKARGESWCDPMVIEWHVIWEWVLGVTCDVISDLHLDMWFRPDLWEGE
jgi:hypothetical protein